jgi:uncharacterized protein YbcI
MIPPVAIADTPSIHNCHQDSASNPAEEPALDKIESICLLSAHNDVVGAMTKGQLEAKISEAVSAFEINYMGRGPKQIKTVICQDLIIIRLKGFLSQAEQKLTESSQGVELFKRVRTSLFEGAREYLEKLIRDVIELDIVSMHSDVSTRTGEKIIVLTLGDNLESRLTR